MFDYDKAVKDINDEYFKFLDKHGKAADFAYVHSKEYMELIRYLSPKLPSNADYTRILDMKVIQGLAPTEGDSWIRLFSEDDLAKAFEYFESNTLKDPYFNEQYVDINNQRISKGIVDAYISTKLAVKDY